jgi:hypothetical protein
MRYSEDMSTATVTPIRTPQSKSPEAFCLVCGHALHMSRGSIFDAERRAKYARTRHVNAFGHKVVLTGVKA